MKIALQRELIVQTFSQPSIAVKASSSKNVSNNPSSSLEYIINALTLEANSLYPPFLLMFENFNYRVHNYLVYSSESLNVMLLSVAKKMNAEWEKIIAHIV